MHFSENMQLRKNRILASNNTTQIRYRNLFNCRFNEIIYNSLINDKYRMVITRWRLSCHKLRIETGRYAIPFIPRDQRLCVLCKTIEDETHSLFICMAHNKIRRKYKDLLDKYSSINTLLDPKNENDIILIAKFITEVEENMKKLKMLN